MWICLNDSFLSIVDKGDPTHATVREPRRHDVYMEVWAALARDQDGTQGR